MNIVTGFDYLASPVSQSMNSTLRFLKEAPCLRGWLLASEFPVAEAGWTC
jgi:hypothetical protein